MIDFNFPYFIATIFTQLLIIYLFSLYSRIKIEVKLSFILIISVSSIIESFLSIHLKAPINAFICMIYFICLFKWLTRLKLKDIFFYMLIIWLSSILIDISLMVILNIIQSVLNYHFNALIVKPVCTVILCIILFILSRFDGINKLIDKAYNIISKISYGYMYIVLIIFLYFIIDVIGIINIENKMIFIILISVVLFTLTIIKFIINKYEIITLKETNNLLINNNEFFIKLIEDYRILKHNLTSQLLGIKSVSNKKSKLLIDDLIRGYNATFLSTQNIKDVPAGLNGIVYEKLYNFNQKDLKVFVENKIKSKIFDSISPRSYNLLSEALGVTLDNAIEAANNSEDKVVYLIFSEDEDKIFIEIMNTFTGVIDLDKIGTINYTSKKNGQGLGLYSLIGRKKLQIQTKIKNNIFKTKIIISKYKQ